MSACLAELTADEMGFIAGLAIALPMSVMNACARKQSPSWRELLRRFRDQTRIKIPNSINVVQQKKDTHPKEKL